MKLSLAKYLLFLGSVNSILAKCDDPSPKLSAASIQAPDQIHSSITNWLGILVVDETVLNARNLTVGLYSPELRFIKDLESLDSEQFLASPRLQTRVGVIVNISPEVANLPTYFILYEPVNCTMFGMSPVKVLDVVGNSLDS
ncbi:hypothetical protein K493DRAFT_304978 [Basidiobolus meristosporus CBS 931.73]|uniref:Uncharacterized protein n=1 Tax=Basidiobolus meristosporus CBS 931.73 TaxID=1314790 RepID=A0A1Y1XXY5_9FUNG|nr:hypothetical protein K493DRAFT_304978 [Basidiobolus meristosporus CBS 931.73]|eukprot:ORX90346.1 hypothetical protein K493DRAFT_304978 [Basidiobolus meristosporus CBS 931.73]